jgi:hypothetical protein
MANGKNGSQVPGYLLMLVGIAATAYGIYCASYPGAEGTISKEASLWPILGGIVITVVGGINAFNNKPIPDEYIPRPEPLILKEDEPWRQPTGFRYLEKLKDHCQSCEDAMREAYQEAVEAYHELSSSSGYIQYRTLRNTIRNNVAYIERCRSEMPKLKEQIQRIFSGDVRSEVLEIEEKIERLKRQRQEYESQVRDKEQETSREQNNDRRRYLEGEKADLRGYIHATDQDIITLQSTLKELKEFDFKKLYGELGVSAEAMRAEATQLSSIREKADIVSQVKAASGSNAYKSQDDQKFERKRSRRHTDVLDKLFEELELVTIEDLEAQKLYKKLRRRILEDGELSTDEKDEALERLEKRYKQKVRGSSITIFEDD